MINCNSNQIIDFGWDVKHITSNSSQNGRFVIKFAYPMIHTKRY